MNKTNCEVCGGDGTVVVHYNAPTSEVTWDTFGCPACTSDDNLRTVAKQNSEIDKLNKFVNRLNQLFGNHLTSSNFTETDIGQTLRLDRLFEQVKQHIDDGRRYRFLIDKSTDWFDLLERSQGRGLNHSDAITTVIDDMMIKPSSSSCQKT